MTTQSLQYSYSGADCDVFAIRGNEIKQLKSVATVSVSVYDAKAPVRALGHRSVKGYTGSIRTVAGSIVFIVVEGHPLEDLMTLNTGRNHYDTDELPIGNVPNINRNKEMYAIGSISPFKLMLLYKNEIGNSAGLEIDDIEFVSEGIVTSVNDMITEVVVQFVATRFKQLTRSEMKTEGVATANTTMKRKRLKEKVKKLLVSLGTTLSEREIDEFISDGNNFDQIKKKIETYIQKDKEFAQALKDKRSDLKAYNLEYEEEQARKAIREKAYLEKIDQLRQKMSNDFKEMLEQQKHSKPIEDAFAEMARFRERRERFERQRELNELEYEIDAPLRRTEMLTQRGVEWASNSLTYSSARKQEEEYRKSKRSRREVLIDRLTESMQERTDKEAFYKELDSITLEIEHSDGLGNLEQQRELYYKEKYGK